MRLRDLSGYKLQQITQWMAENLAQEFHPAQISLAWLETLDGHDSRHDQTRPPERKPGRGLRRVDPGRPCEIEAAAQITVQGTRYPKSRKR